VKRLHAQLCNTVEGDARMMNDMMHGGMMWGMGILWLLVIVVLLLAAAALVKYLFFSGNRRHD